MDTLEDRPDAPATAAEATAHDTHGQSIAAWAAVGVMLVGAVVAAVFCVLWNPVLFWLGMFVMVVAGPALGLVLSKMGYGAGGAKDSFTNSPHHH